MSNDWEDTLSKWGASPSETEQTKAANAERAIRKAIDASDKLPADEIEVFTQGSYANRTNVRQDSDVDICVLYTGAFFADYSMSEGLSREALGLSAGIYDYSAFKNDVHAALNTYFGAAAVRRGSKAFDVHANSYRIDADVVPCFEHRRYMGTPERNWHHCGTELHPDNGVEIINWPRQNYENGVEKNAATSRRFKAVARILKRIRFKLIDDGDSNAPHVPSYLIECLVWNVPNDRLGHVSLTDDVYSALAHLWNETREQVTCDDWGEVNEFKYLFRPSQPWKREDANEFLQGAWDYLGFD